MVPVESSNLKSVGYDHETEILIVEFHGGIVYEYYHVPQYMFEGLLSAQSKGRFHHRHIKNYPNRRIR